MPGYISQEDYIDISDMKASFEHIRNKIKILELATNS